MENKEKYEIIVKIKELLIETKIKSREELEKRELISLNASKVLSLIFQYEELEEFCKYRLNAYEKLTQDELYSKTKDLRKEQILSYIPDEYKRVSPIGIIDNTINIFALFKQPYAEEIADFFINDLIENTKNNLYHSLFTYVDRIRSYFDTNIIPNHVFDCEKHINMFELFSNQDKDEYRNLIISLYDYFYLYKHEFLSSLYGIYKHQSEKYYLYAVYQKILNDCLNHVYSLNLSDEEKQELNKQKNMNEKLQQNRIYFDDYDELKELNLQPRQLLSYIAISEDFNHFKELLKESNIIYSNINQTINLYLSSYFKDRLGIKKGGYGAIKDLLRKNPQWFLPKNK